MGNRKVVVYIGVSLDGYIATKSIWIVGGSQIINMVRKKNLIDEYILSIAPVILGEGIPLFCESEREDLVFDKARTFGQFLEVSYHTDIGIC